MLLAVGGESRRIILGEIPPVNIDQDQDSAQDVAAQWLQECCQGKNDKFNADELTKTYINTNNMFQITTSNNEKDSQMDQKLIADKRSVNNSQKIRKLIPVDFDLKLDDDELDDDEDINTGHKSSNSANYKATLHNNIIPEPFMKTPDKISAYFYNSRIVSKQLKKSKYEYHRYLCTQLESYDLAIPCSSRKVSAHECARSENSLSYFLNEKNPKSLITSQYKYSNFINSTPIKLETRTNTNQNFDFKIINRKLESKSRDNIPASNLNSVEDSTKTQDECGKIFLDEKLSLTLEEIVHIRSVLTKAELESLPVEGRVKEDVEKRKICFLCLKTRFGFLGPWGKCCRLCERTICVKCCSKMKIPTEHFAHVPVILLSPNLLLSPSSSDSNDEIFKRSWSKYRNSINSAPTTPTSKRYMSELSRNDSTKKSMKTQGVYEITKLWNNSGLLKEDYLKFQRRTVSESTKSPAELSTTTTFGSLNKEYTHERDVEGIRGMSMTVCHDCRLMVIQIIKSSRITRTNMRNNVIARLTLNLSPAYI